jgi:hypothetical protein
LKTIFYTAIVWLAVTANVQADVISFRDDVINIYQGGLTPGSIYYFSVDVFDSQSVGTFSLCMTDTD